MKKTRSLLILLVIGVLMVFVTTGYAKDSYPTRPIELLVGYAAGGASDIAARLVAPYMEKELGQPVVVVNKPGAGGEIAYTALAKAAGDGYTLAFINAPATISIPLSHKVNYTMKDYAFIGNVIYHENLIVVKKAVLLAVLSSYWPKPNKTRVLFLSRIPVPMPTTIAS